MAFFVPTGTTQHVITDPDSGETATIEVKDLSAGDVAAIQDTVRMEMGDDKPSADVRMGALKFALVEKSLVSWSLPEDLTPNTLRRLQPSVFDQIFAVCNGVAGKVDPEEAESPLGLEDATLSSGKLAG